MNQLLDNMEQLSIRNITVEMNPENFEPTILALANDIAIHIKNDMEGREGGVYQYVWVINKLKKDE